MLKRGSYSRCTLIFFRLDIHEEWRMFRWFRIVDPSERQINAQVAKHQQLTYSIEISVH